MRKREFIALVLFVGGAIQFYVSSASAQTGANVSDNGYEVAEIYLALRNQAIELGTQGTHDAPVLAVLMETGYSEAVVTLVAVSDGAASLYFSNGGGVIGAGEHAAVRDVAGQWLSLAAEFVSEGAPVDAFPLPEKSRVRFYIVTPSSVFTAEADEEDLGYGRHEFSPLFHQGHELITAIRAHSE